MVTNIESRKVELIAFIALLQQEEAISAIEKTVQEVKSTKKQKQQIVSEAEVQYFKRPIRENVTVEELIQEQNWQPIDENKMDAIAKRLNIQEPIELLLSQLNW